MSKKFLAFTLIELLVVIAIIGILSGLIIVTMNGVTQKANIAKAQIFSNSLRNALMIDLVSEWKFDELSTAVQGSIIQDSWSGANNGTLNTNSDGLDKIRTGTDCVSGKCLIFDGIDDYINIPNSASLKIVDSGSVEFWFNKGIYSNSSGYSGIVAKANTFSHTDQDWGFALNSSDIIFRSYTTGWNNRTIATGVPINEWHLYGATWYYNSTDGYTYIATMYDGKLSSFSSHNHSGKIIDSKPVRFGGYSTSGYYISGYIDQVRMYNAVVPTSQIKQQYYTGLNSLLINGGMTKEEYLSRINETALN